MSPSPSPSIPPQLRDLQAESGARPLHDSSADQCQVYCRPYVVCSCTCIDLPAHLSPLSLSSCSVCEINAEHQLLTVGTEEVSASLSPPATHPLALCVTVQGG